MHSGVVLIVDELDDQASGRQDHAHQVIVSPLLQILVVLSLLLPEV